MSAKLPPDALPALLLPPDALPPLLLFGVFSLEQAASPAHALTTASAPVSQRAEPAKDRGEETMVI
jgi:hypothetical protein